MNIKIAIISYQYKTVTRNGEHSININSGKRSMVKNQSFKARQVDVTAKFSTSLNSSINRDEDLEKINI